MQPRMLLADCMMARTEACVSAGRPGSLHSSSAREVRDAFMDAGSSGEGAGSGFGSGLGLGASSAARLRAKAQRMPCPPARRAQNSMARGRERVCLTEKAMMSNRENGTHSVPMRKDFTRRRCTHDCKQSFRAIVVLCPRYYSKRWKARPADKENQDYVR